MLVVVLVVVVGFPTRPEATFLARGLLVSAFVLDLSTGIMSKSLHPPRRVAGVV